MPGISVSKICVPFGGGGINWSSYWATRNPSGLVLTVLSDTSIKLDWTANGVEDYDGYSVERSADGTTYAEIDTVLVGTETYTDTGLSVYTVYFYRVRAYKSTEYSSYCTYKQSITNTPISDGNTVGWYVADEIATLTKDGSEKVSVWEDKLGSGNDLAQATADAQPVWSSTGIAFDGTDDYMEKAFVLSTPASVYIVAKRTAHEHTAKFFDGIQNATTMTVFAFNPSPNAYMGDGTTNIGPFNTIPINSWFIGRFIYNGASSRAIIDANAAVTGTLANKNAGGFSLAISKSSIPDLFSQNDYREVIVRKVGDSSAYDTAFYNYLMNKYFYTTLSSGNNRFYVPNNFTAKNKVILYCHGMGELANDVLTDYRKMTTIRAFLAQGWGILSCNADGNNWGNQTSLDLYNTLITWAKTQYAFTDISIFAQSMGGMAGLQLFMNDSQYDKFIGIYPACSLSACFVGFNASIKTAYGFVDDADYATATAGHDPMLESGALLAGRKMLLVASPDDVTVAKVANTDAYNTAFGALADITVVDATGVHGDASHFDPARDIAFLNS